MAEKSLADRVLETVKVREQIEGDNGRFLETLVVSINDTFSKAGFEIAHPAELESSIRRIRSRVSIPYDASQPEPKLRLFLDYSLEIFMDGPIDSRRLVITSVTFGRAGAGRVEGPPRAWMYNKPVMMDANGHAEDIVIWLLSNYQEAVNNGQAM